MRPSYLRICDKINIYNPIFHPSAINDLNFRLVFNKSTFIFSLMFSILIGYTDSKLKANVNYYKIKNYADSKLREGAKQKPKNSLKVMCNLKNYNIFLTILRL